MMRQQGGLAEIKNHLETFHLGVKFIIGMAYVLKQSEGTYLCVWKTLFLEAVSYYTKARLVWGTTG